MSEPRVLRCERVVTPGGVLTGVDLRISAGEIAAISPNGSGSAEVEEIGGWVVPGFVDTHCHGGGGADYATVDRDEARRARQFHRVHGTTTTFASLVTAEIDVLCDQLTALAPLVGEGELAGIHLEGPFLSINARGAHEPALLRAPERADLMRLLTVAPDVLRMITIAPELNGAIDAISLLNDRGVVAAIGHTAADVDSTRAALNAGARVATHLFNAMPPMHHRTPGPVPALLTDPRVMVELICDGFHLHADVVALAIAAAGPERVGLVTDAMVAAGMPDGQFRIGRLDVTVRGGQARLIEGDGQLGSIAGSTLTMADAFAFVVRVGCSVAEAAAMAASTPARWHGLDRVGAIEVGRRADLCVVDDRGVLQRVLQTGAWVAA